MNAPVASPVCDALGCRRRPARHTRHHAPDALRALFCHGCWRTLRAYATRTGRTREEVAERLRTVGVREYQARCVWCDRQAPARSMDSVPAEGIGAHECRAGDPNGCATKRGRR
jgi:hypothetical protein